MATAPLTLTKEAVKAWALALPEPPTVRMILYALADHLDSASGTACISLTALAAACHVTRFTIIRNLSVCMEKGYISRERHRQENQTISPNSYRFLVAIPTSV